MWNFWGRFWGGGGVAGVEVVVGRGVVVEGVVVFGRGRRRVVVMMGLGERVIVFFLESVETSGGGWFDLRKTGWRWGGWAYERFFWGWNDFLNG